ncbi:hypothetical protein [Streptococcus sobrinus]|uniref:hypothetical protein n=1 Tax=Streptococcus sobrinus TaxID=1310 RepID=UPI00159E0AC2|nr:hypothetical protein [Streptococcus sobrinus]
MEVLEKAGNGRREKAKDGLKKRGNQFSIFHISVWNCCSRDNYSKSAIRTSFNFNDTALKGLASLFNKNFPLFPTPYCCMIGFVVPLMEELPFVVCHKNFFSTGKVRS